MEFPNYPLITEVNLIIEVRGKAGIIVALQSTIFEPPLWILYTEYLRNNLIGIKNDIRNYLGIKTTTEWQQKHPTIMIVQSQKKIHQGSFKLMEQQS